MAVLDGKVLKPQTRDTIYLELKWDEGTASGVGPVGSASVLCRRIFVLGINRGSFAGRGHRSHSQSQDKKEGYFGWLPVKSVLIFCFSTELALLVLRLREGCDGVGQGPVALLYPAVNATSLSSSQPTDVGWVIFCFL